MKVLVHLILTKMIVICPELILQNVTQILELLISDISLESKPNAVKQEIERLNELIKSAKRLSKALEEMSV